MGLLAFLLVSAIALAVAYRIVSRFLVRTFGLTSTRTTPAHTLRDGIDYESALAAYLLPQHFSAIAAAGPIVGPILAGQYFGWGPAWLWILIGCVLIGGIHDFAALIASVRHHGRSIGEVVRSHMTHRAYYLFLVFVWFALVYVIIAFADITAGTFVTAASAKGGDAPGPAVASSSVLYLLLAVAMGLVIRYTRISATKATLLFLPLVAAAIIVGPLIPLDLSGFVAKPQQLWGFLLLGYCFAAAMAPVWILLQPRGSLGGYFLYVVMAVALLGICVGACTGGLPINLKFFTGWHAPAQMGGMPLFPILFITVACGACSGFHGVVASGTTSKQLDCERDAVVVGYGGMLLEGLFACISLATLMVVTTSMASPNAVYADGLAKIARTIAAPVWSVKGELAADAGYRLLYQFALLCFATFVFDTLDACTRLARYVLMELLGWKSRTHSAIATALTLVFPIIVLALPPVMVNGAPLALWRVFWNIFGSSNQLLASLTLLGVSVWLAHTRKPWLLTFLPSLFMMAMSLWSIAVGMLPYIRQIGTGKPVAVLTHVQFGISCVLAVLALWLLVEAWQCLKRVKK